MIRNAVRTDTYKGEDGEVAERKTYSEEFAK